MGLTLIKLEILVTNGLLLFISMILWRIYKKLDKIGKL